MPTLLYHFTHYKNLHLILDAGELRCANALRQGNAPYTDIAYSSVQRRRAAKPVPCQPGGVIHDYVPFYFAPRSPMLFTISQGNVQTYKDGQEPLIYLVTSVEEVIKAGLSYVFTNGHSIIAYTRFYNDLSHLDQVDWDLMRSSYWANTEVDSDRIRRRQAEFLIHKACPWPLIQEVGVIGREMKANIVEMVQTASHKPSITVRRNWYFLG